MLSIIIFKSATVFISGSFGCGLHIGNTAYAATFSASLDPVDSAPIYDRTPLVLVHGIHGKEDGADYWKIFVTYFNTSILSSHYKLYKYEYDSDVVSVSTIGQYLANEINSKLAGHQIVILAHSMGGLVGRSYMQEHGGNEKIIKLITLATPHHGTPGANDEDALEPFSTNYMWDKVFSVSQILYYLSIKNHTTIWSDMPNRSDLRWDGILPPQFDKLINVGTFNAPIYSKDENTWLANLNSSIESTQADKIIAYSGYLDPYSELWLEWSNPETLLNGNFADLKDIAPHEGLTVASAVMGAGLLNYYFYLNDGMVPFQSASFSDRMDIKRRLFFGYDHLDMKDGKIINGRIPLFDSITADLMAALGPIDNGYGSVYTGNIEVAGQEDTYVLEVTTPGVFVLYTRGTTNTSCTLYDSNLNHINAVEGFQGELNNFYGRYEINTSGTYYIGVEGSYGTSTGPYGLHVESQGKGTFSDDHGMSAWSATPVPIGSVTSGVLDLVGDKDFFKFSVVTPGVYAIYSRGTTPVSGVLYDSNYNNYYSTSFGDGELDNFWNKYIISIPGTYFLRVNALYGSPFTGNYQVHIDGPDSWSTSDRDDHGLSAWSGTKVRVGSVTSGTLDIPGDRDFFKFDVETPGKYVIYTRGETDTFGTLIDSNYGDNLSSDDNSGETGNFRIEYSITNIGTYYIRVRGYSSTTLGSYNLHIDGPGAGSTEDRDDHGMSAWNSTRVDIGSITSGVISLSGDMDFFKFYAGTPGSYTLYTSGSTNTSGRLYDWNYNSITSSGTGGDQDNFKIIRTISTPGFYYLEVKGASSSTLGNYEVHIDGPSDVSLTGLSINGDATVYGHSTSAYIATANWSNGTTSAVMPIWSENSSYASINSDGLLSTAVVESNQTITITATFSTSGITKTATKTITCTPPPDLLPPDLDGDGIPNSIENAANHTSNSDADTDDDGIPDGVEDANQNGIVDNGETDPGNPDSDGDGIQDGTELGCTLEDIGEDTNRDIFIPDADPASITDPLNPDSDNDGKSDGEEDANSNGAVDEGETDPNISDRLKSMPWIPLLLLDD